MEAPMTSPEPSAPCQDREPSLWPWAALVFGFVLLLAAFSVHESVTWLHIRTGADIIAARALPTADSFSYTAAGRPWTTDSWLADVLFQHLDQTGGFQSLVALKCLVLAAAFALLLPLNPGNPMLAAGVLALGAAAAWPGMTETPGCFDFLLLALLLRALRPKRGFSWSIAAQVFVIEALWANLDGGSAVLGLWLVGLKVVKTTFSSERGERLRFSSLLLAAAAGFALNPHGFAVAGRVFSEAPAQAWGLVSPWVSLYALFALAGAAAVWLCLQEEFFLALSAASLLALSLLAPSWRPLYVLAACPLVCRALGHFTAPCGATAGCWARLALIMAGLFAWHWQSVTTPLGRARGYGSSALDGAVNFLDSNGVSGRLFNEPETGAELLARSRRPVFVDSRAELYGAPFMKDAELWPSRFRQLAEAYRFDAALVLNRRAAYPARVIDEAPDWRLAYADDGALVYLRRSGAAGLLVAGSARRRLAPNRLWPDALDALRSRSLRQVQVLPELDRWIVQSPESVQPLLWKAYAFDCLAMPEKAERLLTLARSRLRWRRDPELLAVLGFVLEKRGKDAEARGLYEDAALMARRRGEDGLRAQVLLRLAGCVRRAGDESRARRLESRAQALAARAQP